MKKFLNLIAVSTLVATSIPPCINTILNAHINHKVDFVNDKIWNKLINKWANDLKKGGNNYYDYYGFYYVIGLSHKVVNDINNAIGAGVSAVVAVLNATFPGVAWIMTIFAAILVAQWYCWEIPDYDNGNGVVIKMIGGLVAPSVIVGVSSQ